jgi:hypothetical protein
MFISISKSCIIKPNEHLNPVLSLNFEFLVSKAKEKDDEEVSNEISRLLGQLGHRSYKYQERLSRRGLSCTKTGTRCYNLPCMGIVLQYTLQPEQSPSIPQYTKAVLLVEVKAPSTEVPMNLKVLPPYVVDSYIKRIKQVCNKEGLSPRMSRK